MNLNATLGAGRLVLNDYVLEVSDIAGGHRLTLSRGNEVKTLDVLNGAEGRGISGALLNADSQLVLTFTDGEAYVTPSLKGERGLPGTTLWADIQDKPGAFTPAAHTHSQSEITGLSALLSALDAPVRAVNGSAANLAAGETVVFEGAPTALTLTLPEPTEGRDYMISVIFRAGAGFTLTHQLPAGCVLKWAQLPAWQENAFYELVYRCLWLKDAGSTVIAVRWESVA